MKFPTLYPDEVVALRNSGKRLLTGRFGVVRVRGNVAPDGGFFWSFDDLEDAKSLCRFLVTEKLGAYVFDTVIYKKAFELAVSPS